MITKLPDCVAKYVEWQLLMAAGIEKPWEARIISLKPSITKIKLIGLALPNSRLRAYELSIDHKEESLPGSRKVAILYEILPNLPEHEINELLYQDNINKPATVTIELLIATRETKLLPIIGIFCDLELLYRKFKDNKKFVKKITSLIETYYIDNECWSSQNNAKGLLFEFMVAQMYLADGRNVIDFDAGYETTNESVDYDLEAEESLLIECKLSDFTIDTNQILKKARVALYHEKQFQVYFWEQVSDKTKKWFNENKILFRDGIKYEIQSNQHSL